MKPTLYLDTSVVSAYFDKRDVSRQRLTKDFWSKLDSYEVYISTLVQEELAEINDMDLREKLVKSIKRFKIIKIGRKEGFLAEQYAREGVVSEKFIDDAYHIAVATTNNLDYLVSWNFKHIVNVKTRWLVNLVNLRNNYKPIEIVAPPEL
jgi:predicted nucleic acid-binding protein